MSTGMSVLDKLWADRLSVPLNPEPLPSPEKIPYNPPVLTWSANASVRFTVFEVACPDTTSGSNAGGLRPGMPAHP